MTKIVSGHPNRDIDQLLPWAYCTQSLKAVGSNDASMSRHRRLLVRPIASTTSKGALAASSTSAKVAMHTPKTAIRYLNAQQRQCTGKGDDNGYNDGGGEPLIWS
ncbi:hypothetical protein [Bradyrhizobium sp. BWA-3-5]|uniref:hypothetical protein n=1 Tax=Bradyrhizobium sp. BWA-3-5 TaxID=3080013 RepID=UPI00397AD22B